MHNLSFDFPNAWFNHNGFEFGCQVFSYENAYSFNGEKCRVNVTTDGTDIQCSELLWAGGQETAQGSASISVQASENCTTWKIRARAAQTIRSVKLMIRDIPDGAIVNLRETERKEIPPEGLILNYPEGWRNLYSPLVVLHTVDGRYLYFRSLDTQVRQKRFAFLRRGNKLDVELIFEELSTDTGTEIDVPIWEVGTCSELTDILEHHRLHVREAFDLKPWETREDVPTWVYDISLIAAIHCQHWTGYIFNNYDDVLRNIEYLVQFIEPQHVLVYLPGWEGRYYWQYGDYLPDPRMGGAEGFKRLIESARDIGVHMMPMFGINVVNKGMPNFEQWGEPAIVTSSTGMTGGSTVDWDGSRHYDHGWGVLLNPGAPAWQNRLVQQIRRLIDQYGFEAVFLDITAAWVNDPRHNLFEGTQQLIARIREGHPEILVAGEGWYDAMGTCTPLVQSGHTEGVMHWHDLPYNGFFDTYCRSFGHLCLGDPGRGSTGVHELGTNREIRTPVRKANIPTVTLVENTLEKAPDKVREIIEDAKHYADKFLAQRELVSQQIPERHEGR